MFISLVLAWVAVLLAAGTAFRYLARISKSPRWDRIFHKIHIPAGVALVLVGLLHGLLAGNPAGTKWSEVQLGGVLFSLSWGTACFAVSVLLGFSYLLRKILKKNWMVLHRILTIGMLALLVLHLLEVGIQLPSRIFAKEEKRENVSVTETKSEMNNGTESGEESISELFSGAKLLDGVYEGSAQGYKDLIMVSVTVKDGAVFDIQILEENDTPNYFACAESVIADIVDQQSLEVDAVSGATYSSEGILQAVHNALEAAVSEGELETAASETNSGNDSRHNGKGGHGRHQVHETPR